MRRRRPNTKITDASSIRCAQRSIRRSRSCVDTAPYRRRLGAQAGANERLRRALRAGVPSQPSAACRSRASISPRRICGRSSVTSARRWEPRMTAARDAAVSHRSRARLAHEQRQDHTGAHAARSRHRRSARRSSCHRAGRSSQCCSTHRPATSCGCGTRRASATRRDWSAPAPGRQPDRLAVARSLGPPSRPAILVQPAGRACCTGIRRCRALPRQRRRTSARRRLCRRRDRRYCAGSASRCSCC